MCFIKEEHSDNPFVWTLPQPAQYSSPVSAVREIVNGASCTSKQASILAAREQQDVTVGPAGHENESEAANSVQDPSASN